MSECKHHVSLWSGCTLCRIVELKALLHAEELLKQRERRENVELQVENDKLEETVARQRELMQAVVDTYPNRNPSTSYLAGTPIERLAKALEVSDALE